MNLGKYLEVSEYNILCIINFLYNIDYWIIFVDKYGIVYFIGLFFMVFLLMIFFVNFLFMLFLYIGIYYICFLFFF